MKTIDALVTRDVKWRSVDFTSNGREFSTHAKTIKSVIYMVKYPGDMLDGSAEDTNLISRTDRLDAINVDDEQSHILSRIPQIASS